MKKHSIESEVNPQRLLPPELRRTWTVVPRDALYQLLLVGLLFGAGLALTVVGIVLGSVALQCALPAAFVLSLLQRILLPWSEVRLLKELRVRLEKNSG